MPKSFVFRNREGKLGGYLLQRGDGLCCRVYDVEDGVRLTVALSSGGVRRFDIPDSRKECFWEGTGGEIEAAFIELHGVLVMDTGDKGKALFRELACRDDGAAGSHPCQTGIQAPAACSAEISRRMQAARARAYPQRRWPPPVLMCAPVYLQGGWTDESEGKDGRDG